MKTVQEWKLEESSKLPDVGEMVEFETAVEAKINGKPWTIEPAKELEVISKSGNSIELKCKSGSFHMTVGEYKAHGGHLV